MRTFRECFRQMLGLPRPKCYNDRDRNQVAFVRSMNSLCGLDEIVHKCELGGILIAARTVFSLGEFPAWLLPVWLHGEKLAVLVTGGMLE